MNKLLFQKKIITISISVIFLSGFTEFIFKPDVTAEVDRRMSEIRTSTRPSTGLEQSDIKDLSDYQPYQFKAKDSNPFAVKNFVGLAGTDINAEDEDLCRDPACGDGPPTPHAKYFLENYNIDQLSMIGTMTDKLRGRVALIQTPDSGVVYVAQGEYIGQNNGLVLSVNKDRVIVREKYRSPQGWQDRMARLPLLKK